MANANILRIFRQQMLTLSPTSASLSSGIIRHLRSVPSSQPFFSLSARLASTAMDASSDSDNSDGLVTVRIVSINDVYDLTKLPRLATFLRSLGPHSQNDSGDSKYDKRIKPSAVTLNGDFISPSTLSSIDNGRGHVAAIRASGITHVCLGNHEADIPLAVLKERLDDLAKGKRIVVLNSNVRGLGRHSRELDIIRSSCGQIKVGLLGLLSDEDGMFRDGTFKGLQIDDVKKKYEEMLEKVHTTMAADCLVPLTHQTLTADIGLARWMLQLQLRSPETKHQQHQSFGGGVILGGHEHTKIHEHVSLSEDQLPTNGVQIVKTGMNSDRAAVIDLQFDSSTHTLLSTNVHFEELDENHQPCPIVSTIVKKHMSALDELQDFVVFDSKSMLSEFFNDPSTGKRLPLSSECTRYEQTTVGAFFCTAVKSELGTDVCIINGAPIKASKVYTTGTMSYDELRNELPFPLKMVVVEMTRKQLREAIHFSRTNVEEGKVSEKREDGSIERRGYLQTDFEYWMHGSHLDSLRDDEMLTVALPRNLLSGFCKIQPLMDLRNELESRCALPAEDNYIKAIDIIVRYCCHDRWDIISKVMSFNDLDLNKDGSLSRDEVRDAIKRILGEDPSDALVDSMVTAIDVDSDGRIDQNEFNESLSKLGHF